MSLMLTHVCRQADKYLVDNPLADKAAAERAAAAAPADPQTPALLASGSLGNSGGQQVICLNSWTPVLGWPLWKSCPD